MGGRLLRGLQIERMGLSERAQGTDDEVLGEAFAETGQTHARYGAAGPLKSTPMNEITPAFRTAKARTATATDSKGLLITDT